MKLKIFDIQNLAVAYVCLWATSPMLAYGLEFRLAAIAALGLWAVLEMSRPGGIFLRPTLPAALAAVYILYTAMIEIVLGEDGYFAGHFQIWILLFFLIFYESRRNDVRSMAPIFWFMVATLPVWLFTTYTGLDTFGSHAARALTRSSDLARELTAAGVGGYSLVYGTVVMLPVFAVLLLNVRRFVPIESPAILRGPSKIPLLLPGLLLANLLLGVAVVIRAGFSIAILLAVASVILSLFFRRRSPVFLLFVPSVVAMAFIFMAYALVPLLEGLRPLTEGTPYYRKVLDLIATLESDQAKGAVDDRWLRYKSSMERFASSPVFGTIGDNTGGHSTYLDTYARYGVFIGSLMAYVLLYLPVRMMKAMRNNFGLALSIFAIMVLLPLLNVVQASLGLMLFVMVPVASDLVEQGRVRLPSPLQTRRPGKAARLDPTARGRA